MGLRLIGHKTLYRHPRFFSAFPSVQAMPEGHIMLAFRRAPDHRWMMGEAREEDLDAVDHLHFRSHIAMIKLAPDMTALTEPEILPVHAEASDQDASLFLTKSGRLIQHGFLWYPVSAATSEKLEEAGQPILSSKFLGCGYMLWGGYTRYSDDGGKAWSAHHVLPLDHEAPEPRYPWVPGGAAVRGRMVELPNGELLMPVYGILFDGLDHYAVRFYKSGDNGETWQLLPGGVRNETIGLSEPALACWPAGQLTAFCRTAGNKDQMMVMSAGQGDLVFSEPRDMGVKGHPCDPLVLPDGRLFLVYGYRHAPMGVRARLVEPGQSFDDAEEIIIRDDSPCRDAGYPWATQLADGRILIAYYITDKAGIRGIEGTLVAID